MGPHRRSRSGRVSYPRTNAAVLVLVLGVGFSVATEIVIITIQQLVLVLGVGGCRLSSFLPQQGCALSLAEAQLGNRKCNRTGCDVDLRKHETVVDSSQL